MLENAVRRWEEELKFVRVCNISLVLYSDVYASRPQLTKVAESLYLQALVDCM